MAIAALLNDALQLPAGRGVRAVPALEALAAPLDEGLLVAVSHEGGTHITNEAVRAARAGGTRTALITVSGRSPGAEDANLVLATEEQDQSWCHTVGYLSPLIVGVVLASRLSRARLDAIGIRALLDVADDPPAAAAAASALANSDRLIEGARLPAAALELETVLHGHLAAATRWTGLVLILTGGSDGVVRERTARVLEAARTLAVPGAAILSAEVAASVPPQDTPAGRIVLPRLGRVPRVAGSLLGSAVALQLLTERLARVRGVNPDTLGREDPAQAAAHA